MTDTNEYSDHISDSGKFGTNLKHNRHMYSHSLCSSYLLFRVIKAIFLRIITYVFRIKHN